MAVGSSDAFLLVPGERPLYGHSAARSTSPPAASTATPAEEASAAFIPTPAAPQRITGSDLLSLDFDDLAKVLEGSGRAKMVWAALSQGVDPFSEAATEFLTDKTAAVLTENVQRLPWQVGYSQHLSSSTAVHAFIVLRRLLGDLAGSTPAKKSQLTLLRWDHVVSACSPLAPSTHTTAPLIH